MTAVVELDALQERKVKIRRHELLLALEQWAPAYRDVAGDCLRYVFEIAGATEDEQTWLRQQVAVNGMPQTAGRTPEQLRAQGGRANAAAGAAFLAGDYDKALDLIDEARAYGTLFDGEWVKLHRFIAAKAAAEAADASGETTATVM